MPNVLPFIKFNLGTYRALPQLDLVMYTPTIYRSLGTIGDTKILGIERNTDTFAKKLEDSVYLGHPWTSADPVDTYHYICGYALYTTNQEGVKVYSGYDVYWRYRVTDVVWADVDRVTLYQVNIQVVKIKHDTPSDITILGQHICGMGGMGGIANIEVYLIALYDYHNSDYWTGVGFGWIGFDSQGNKTVNRYETVALSKYYFTSSGYDNPMEIADDPNENDPGGNSGEGGGDGTHDYSDDAIPLPTLPTLSACGVGMITLYRMQESDMLSFAHDLWSDGWTQIISFFSDPMDFIIGCMILPFTPAINGSAAPKFGLFTWNNYYKKISNQFQAISCGEIDIRKFYGSCFDYDPYRKIQIYLPYIGYRDLPVDKIMDKTIACTYYCDCFTGDCVAFIHTSSVGEYGPQKTQVLGQYAGNVGVRVPLARQSWDAAISAGISLLGGAVAAGVGGIAQSAGIEGKELTVSQIGNQAGAATMSAVNAAKTSIKRSGTQGATAGYMSIQDPFIIDIIPRQSLPDHYKDLEGYPSNIYGEVGSFSGFLAVEKIKLETNATETEKDMIMQLLKGGVYV